MTARTANLATALGLGLLMAGIAFSAPRWARWLSEPMPVEDDASVATPEGALGEHDGGTPARRTISVRVFFVSPDTGGLVPEEREVEFSPELASQVKNVVGLLLSGSNSGLGSPYPENARVLEVFLTARGVAYVSLSQEAAGLEGGTAPELLAVYSLVNTVVTNFASIKRVHILVGDRMVDTLAGHVDLSRPLGPDFSLLALPSAPPEPLPSPSGDAPVSTSPTAGPVSATPGGA